MPTPANPFGSVADIFDILEQATEHAIAPSAPQTLLPSADHVAAEEPIVALDNRGAPEPLGLALAEAVAPVDPQDIAASGEPVVGPPIQPVIIGTGEKVAATKRGWWRR
jgi:hypothetical protein